MILALDAYEAIPSLLESEPHAVTILKDAAALTGMTIIREPQVMTYRDPLRPGDWGVTGDVWIAESHIALHTWPSRRYLHFLLDSCRDFAARDLGAYVCRYYGARLNEHHVIDAGLRSMVRKGLLSEEAPVGSY